MYLVLERLNLYSSFFTLYQTTVFEDDFSGTSTAEVVVCRINRELFGDYPHHELICLHQFSVSIQGRPTPTIALNLNPSDLELRFSRMYYC